MGSVLQDDRFSCFCMQRQDYESIKFIRAAAVPHGNKFETDWVNIPHIKARRGHETSLVPGQCLCGHPARESGDQEGKDVHAGSLKEEIGIIVLALLIHFKSVALLK